MVDDNEVKTKGRICVSNESLSFERKIGFISKKFEPILKIPIKSIMSINKKSYVEISVNYIISDQKVIKNIIFNTPAEVIEIMEKIGCKLNEKAYKYLNNRPDTNTTNGGENLFVDIFHYRNLNYHEYYDEELKELVSSKDKEYIEQFDYKF